MLCRRCSALTLVLASSCVASALAQDVAPPANAPAKAQWNADTGELVVEYHGAKILSASVSAKDVDGKSVALPAGYRVKSAEVDGEKTEIANRGETATVRIVPSSTKTVQWRTAFAR